MLAWFDTHPEYYLWLVCVVPATILVLMLRPLMKADWQNSPGADWRWALAILALLVVGRWPMCFVTRQLSEDESQLLAGAITLRHDPVFWRSVDGGTAGPLDYFALLPMGWLRGADDFASARLTALVLMALALIFTHASLAQIFGRQVARIATFAAACVEAFSLHYDLQHYSTELLPVALLALVVWLGTRRFLLNADWKWTIAAGFILGAIPFAKLQAGPVALWLGICWIAGEIWGRGSFPSHLGRTVWALSAAALMPLFIVIVVLTSAGLWQHALVPYVLHNLAYVDAATLTTTKSFSLSWLEANSEGALLGGWMVGCGVWLLLTLPFARVASREQRMFAFAMAGFLLVSLISVLAPRHAHLHYFQFLVIPGTLVFGATMGLILQGLGDRSIAWRNALLCGALLSSGAVIVSERAGLLHPYVGQLALFQAHPQGPVAKELRKYAEPGESIGVWGWMSSCYAETGFRQATRDAHSAAEITPGPYQDYFRRRYLADLETNAPPLFIDAVAPGSFFFKNPALRHDVLFPELAAHIRHHYTLIANLGGNRVYVRNDRVLLLRR